MTRLTLGDAIARFKDNDERLDVFTNGGDTETWETSEGVVLPSAAKLFKDTTAEVTDLSDRLNSYQAYTIVIESSLGTVFRPGETLSTTLSARVFKNGAEVTNTLAASRFKWRRVSSWPLPYPDDDETWNSQFLSGYRSISVDTSDIRARATFFCEITD